MCVFLDTLGKVKTAQYVNIAENIEEQCFLSVLSGRRSLNIVSQGKEIWVDSSFKRPVLCFLNNFSLQDQHNDSLTLLLCLRKGSSSQQNVFGFMVLYSLFLETFAAKSRNRTYDK